MMQDSNMNHSTYLWFAFHRPSQHKLPHDTCFFSPWESGVPMIRQGSSLFSKTSVRVLRCDYRFLHTVIRCSWSRRNVPPPIRAGEYFFFTSLLLRLHIPGQPERNNDCSVCLPINRFSFHYQGLALQPGQKPTGFRYRYTPFLRVFHVFGIGKIPVPWKSIPRFLDKS